MEIQMRIVLKASFIAVGLLLAAPAASALTSSALPRAATAEGIDVFQQAAAKHHRKHYKRRGCRLTYGGLVCGGGKHAGGHKRRHGKGHGNRHGGNRH
jgi:hypothetical protein